MSFQLICLQECNCVQSRRVRQEVKRVLRNNRDGWFHLNVSPHRDHSLLIAAKADARYIHMHDNNSMMIIRCVTSTMIMQ